MSPITISILALNGLVCCLCIAILGLVAHSVALKDAVDSAATTNLKGTGMSFLFWPGVGGIVDMSLFLILWTNTPPANRPNKKRTACLNGLLFVSAFILIRPLITLIYVFVEHSKAIKGEASPVSGYITVETWACALSDGTRTSTTGSLCTELHAARMILIPVLVLSCVQLALVIWLRIVGTREQHANKKSMVEGGRSPTSKVEV